jgi:endonuclease-3
MEILPEDMWFKATYLLIEHGRAICAAKKAKCGECAVSGLCPSAFKV